MKELWSEDIDYVGLAVVAVFYIIIAGIGIYASYVKRFQGGADNKSQVLGGTNNKSY